MNEHQAQIIQRRALLNTDIKPAVIASVLNKTASLLSEHGWQPRVCINGNEPLDICRALRGAVELSQDSHDGLWYACREALLKYLNEFSKFNVYGLAAWNDKQYSAEEVIQTIREAASRIVLPPAI